ncbi:hypothetical protein K6119_04295 [Paracrocinitomix mangrovi]|uniref:hypothetical protein n=1 Tax=Paracrocinitomix mangrovi TaxID=2862509 RepID=UPI001C8D43DC|nr:hypothetical protein [Paracrocinitomix mangrovi]UKN02734.1 hypothetical protein K6119_04295 [Paracrocinitomix mangrovi]
MSHQSEIQTFINKFYLYFVLFPLLTIGGISLLFQLSTPPTDPFSGMANFIWKLLFLLYVILMVVASLGVLSSKIRWVQKNVFFEILLWFIAPFFLDFIIVFGRINGNDLDIGLISANLMLLLAISNLITLVIGYYQYRMKLKSILEH